MPSDDFLSKEDILAGLPAKRARTLLFLIENRVGLLAEKSRRAMDPFFDESAERDIDTAYLESFSVGRTPPTRATIQDIERFAPDWAPLVSPDPRIRTHLAHHLADKYSFARKDIPGIRSALGLDEGEVERCYTSSYGVPLETVYTPSANPLERIRWLFSACAERIENLSPFWTAFSLTLTETVGASILALPIALARVGPLAGVVVVIVLGLVNVATVGFLAKAIARSAGVRYGNAFFGRILTNYLGRPASVVLCGSLAILCFLLLQAYYIGFSTTLADATSISPMFWTAILFVMGLYYVSRKSLSSTVASALTVGAVNITVILVISAIVASGMKSEYFQIDSLRRPGLDTSLLELIFGVVLVAYFGHLSICNCARVVLRRDPSGRSLIWGSMSAMFLAAVIYAIWVLAVNGAVEPARLAGLRGTALAPLAAQFGPVITLVGSIYVILGMGMASVHYSLGLFNLVRERLPAPKAVIVALPSRVGRVSFHKRWRTDAAGPHIGLSYLGLRGNMPRFLLQWQMDGRLHHEEIAFAGRWEFSSLLERFPGAKMGPVSLALEIIEAGPDLVRLQCETSLAVAFSDVDPDDFGLAVSGILDLPDKERKFLSWLLRRGEVSLEQAAAKMKSSGEDTRQLLDSLQEKRFVLAGQSGAGPRYRAVVAPRRGRTLPEHIWKALGDEAPISPGSGPASGRVVPAGRAGALKAVLSGEVGRFLLCVGPIAAAFLFTEWSFYTGKESFSGVLSLVGIFVVPLLAGVFPVLMLISSRRKGEYAPRMNFGIVGNSYLLVCIYLLFLACLFIHGLFIWRAPLPRAAALLVGILVPILTCWIARKGGFTRRTVVELRWSEQQGSDSLVTLMSAGKPLVGEISLKYPEGVETFTAAQAAVKDPNRLQRVGIVIPGARAGELEVLAHSEDAGRNVRPLEGTLEVSADQEASSWSLALSDGEILVPISGERIRLSILLPLPDESLFPVNRQRP